MNTYEQKKKAAKKHIKKLERELRETHGRSLTQLEMDLLEFSYLMGAIDTHLFVTKNTK